MLLNSRYTKTGLVFGFSKNQILVAVIPGQKAPRTLLGQNSFWILSKNNIEMGIKQKIIFSVEIYLDGVILKAVPEYTKLTTKMYCIIANK